MFVLLGWTQNHIARVLTHQRTVLLLSDSVSSGPSLDNVLEAMRIKMQRLSTRLEWMPLFSWQSSAYTWLSLRALQIWGPLSYQLMSLPYGALLMESVLLAWFRRFCRNIAMLYHLGCYLASCVCLISHPGEQHSRSVINQWWRPWRSRSLKMLPHWRHSRPTIKPTTANLNNIISWLILPGIVIWSNDVYDTINY